MSKKVQPMTKVTIRIPVRIKDKLDKIARMEQRSTHWCCNEALRLYATRGER